MKARFLALLKLHYLTSIVPNDAQHLLMMAGLPLIDGVFVGAMSGNAFVSPGSAAAFGAGVFSGAGCIAASIRLSGSVPYRLMTLFRIYFGVILPVALVFAAISTPLKAVLLPDFSVFAALVLIGVALDLLGISISPSGSWPTRPHGEPQPIAAQWRWSARLIVTPSAVLCVAGAASLLHLIEEPPSPGSFDLFSVSPESMTFAGISVIAGFLLTAIGALVVAAVIERTSGTWLRRGGGTGLLILASTMIGIPMPELAPLLPLLVALLIDIAISLMHTMTKGGNPK